MTELKLAKLPDRTPVKVGITISPELNKSLQRYAELYRQAYGTTESVLDLIPFMLDGFLKADRSFNKARKEMKEAEPSTSTSLSTALSSSRPVGSGKAAG